jgi:Uma2 family endonuclease
VFINDMKLHLADKNCFYYPDVMVTCDPQDTHAFYTQHPCLLVEVLSPSTETIDRREKLMAYRSLAALQHYLLVSTEERRVEWHSRDAAGRWLIATLEGSDTLTLDCQDLQASFTLDDIYEDVNLT